MPEENLWPTDFGKVAQKPPVSILREQANALGERTANIVVGTVQTTAPGAGKFYHYLSLYSAPLAYRTPLLSVTHGIELYPATLQLADEPDTSLVASNPSELKEHLKELFSREKTRRIIASLLAQSQE